MCRFELIVAVGSIFSLRLETFSVSIIYVNNIGSQLTHRNVHYSVLVIETKATKNLRNDLFNCFHTFRIPLPSSFYQHWLLYVTRANNYRCIIKKMSLDKGIPLPPNWPNLTAADGRTYSNQLADFISAGGYARYVQKGV